MNENTEQVNDRIALYISRLIAIKLRGRLSVSQQQDLEDWLSLKESNRNLFNQLNDLDVREDILHYFLKQDTEKALLTLKSVFHGSAFATDKEVPNFWTIRNFHWAAAAIAFGLVAATLFFLIIPTEYQPAVHNISNKATLTLATGQTIPLNTKNDLLIVEDNKLRYQDGSTIVAMSAHQAEKSAIENPAELKITTPAGGHYNMVLPDGTKIWLNAATTVTFPHRFSGSARLVRLSGEAYFKVAHNENLPFIVQTQTQRIRVLGTEFNVTSYPDDPCVKTTLVQGSVKVNAGKKTLMLKPGEQAEFNGKSSLTSHKIAIEEELAWKTNAINFNNKSFRTIMNELARYYDLQVVYQGEAPVLQFYGSINYGTDVSVVLEVLTAAGLKYELKERTLTIKS